MKNGVTLQEKIRSLVHHDCVISVFDDDESCWVPCVIQEVNLDHLVVRSHKHEVDEHVQVGCDWYIQYRSICHILHLHNCRYCAARAAIAKASFIVSGKNKEVKKYEQVTRKE